MILPLLPLLPSIGIESTDMRSILGELPKIGKALAAYAPAAAQLIPLSGTRLGPPSPHPTKILELGINTPAMMREAKKTPNRYPAIFAKPPSTVVGPHDAIVRPVETSKLDYEVELAVVIGRKGRRIQRDRAWDHVAGLMIANDITARDVQFGELAGDALHKQNFLAKSFDTFCPSGPWLTTMDEIPDVSVLEMTLLVNGEPRQRGFVADLIWDIPTLIEYCSATMTLDVGDIILTGSPGGTGYYMKPPQFLNPGDVVRSAISGIGFLENTVVAESVQTS